MSTWPGWRPAQRTWEYQVPNLAGSKWGRDDVATMGYERDWPRVGVFCKGRQLRGSSRTSHADDLWLVGSLVASPAVLEQTGAVHWDWEAKYPTGDGFLIRLEVHRREVGRQSGAEFRGENRGNQINQPLEGDRVLRNHAEVSDADQSAVRADYRIACHVCGLDYKWRSERLQEPATKLWSAGVREVSLWSLAGRV